MQKSAFSPLSARRAGFTLAEVMIAMGIVASVMVALLGMIPLGVRSVREAANLAICGRISQEVINNIQQAPWSNIKDSFDGKTFKFDHEGFLLTAKSRETVATYEARVRLASEDEISFGKTKYDQTTLRKVLVDVEYTPDGLKIPIKDSTAGKEGNPNIRSYNFYVANQNKSGA